MAASASFYALGAETVCHLWNCVAASALQAYRHCSSNESSAGLVMPQDVPKVSSSMTFSFPHRLARGAGQLKTWATTIKAGLEPISGPRVSGYARWRKDWVKVASELALDR